MTKSGLSTGKSSHAITTDRHTRRTSMTRDLPQLMRSIGKCLLLMAMMSSASGKSLYKEDKLS